MERRTFLGSVAAWCLAGCQGNRQPKVVGGEEGSSPTYLAGYETLYARDPRQAARAWFADARFGLFLHYGLYSQLGRGEWVMYHEQIPVAEYGRLKETFRADRFDADYITDLALAAGMRYVNLTGRHHDGFCLFETSTTDFHSVNSPAKRDLVGEMAEQCRRKGLGFFVYHSYGLDWRHPYFFPRAYAPFARPDYAEPEPTYRWESDEDFQKYLADADQQVRELLSNYGPLAGIWFDPIATYYAQSRLFPMTRTYAMVRRLQRQTLISYKQGATGTEDFAAPERAGQSLEDVIRKRDGEAAAQVAARAWARNRHKHNEICDTLQTRAWGYDARAEHQDAQAVTRMLAAAGGQHCNLLLNTGPLGDGSIHPQDADTLRTVGRLIAANGWPAATTEPPEPAP